MRRRRLGANGPEISVIGFGAWEAGGTGWGAPVPDDHVIAAMHAAFDSGVDWIDTAEVYGNGRSEEIVAEAVRDRPGVRVFTKVAPSRSGTDRDGVRRGAEGSLARLGRDVIDLYQVHWPSPETPLEETWEAMASLVDDRLVRWIGLSNYDLDGIERCQRIRHVDSLQPHFSLLHRDRRDDTLPFCAANGIGVIAYGPLAYGLLTGAITTDTRFPDDDWRGGKMGTGLYARFFAPGVRERHLSVVDALRPVAERRGLSLAQLALAWAVHQDGVTGAIAGSRSASHTAENAAAGDVVLDDETLAEIETIVGAA